MNSFIVGPQMLYLKFSYVRDQSKSRFHSLFSFTRLEILGVLLNPDEEEFEIILALNSHFTKKYMWVDQIYINSDFLYFERHFVY